MASSLPHGNYQDARILPVLTSGAATAMWNGFRRVDAVQAQTKSSTPDISRTTRIIKLGSHKKIINKPVAC